MKNIIFLLLIASPAFAQKYNPAPFSPKGSELVTKPLGDGVYALITEKATVYNSGFIIGDEGVLVVDSHLNDIWGRKIQKAVRDVTTKPILYLVNSNMFAYSTFGNSSFDANTQIVGQASTLAFLENFEGNRNRALRDIIPGDTAFFENITLRLPDIKVNNKLELDLGNRVVKILHLGQGVAPGDMIVLDKKTRTAFTGHLMLGSNSIPWVISGGAGEYRKTLKKLKRLDIELIVSGFGALDDEQTIGAIADPDLISSYIVYLDALISTINRGVKAGKTVADIKKEFKLEDSLGAYNSFSPMTQGILQVAHSENIGITFREYSKK